MHFIHTALHNKTYFIIIRKANITKKPFSRYVTQCLVFLILNYILSTYVTNLKYLN